ncbi:TetR/AcrR family transcriptional regulator [Marinitenerispora sediminis]|uniref:TetR/AcrR family transcriptional regulator n=1 Tax=Marinitenerispora sediminis TaxID=1931232 RepID=UPI001313EC86|nr:TetR/AcrR family transcriptional regulator [Marinitenerispora sediminis]
MTDPITEPRNARSRRTRTAVLAAARAILEERGPAALTMAEAAERAGVTRRAVYLHFSSRTELVIALFDYLAEEEGLHESVRRVWQRPDSVAGLEEWARHLARYHPRVLAVDQAVRRVRNQDPDAARHYRRATESQRANCRRLAEWLAHEGRLAPAWTADSATDMLWALISSDLIEALHVERGWSEDQLAGHLALMFRRTFVDPAGVAGSAAAK